MAFRRCMRSEKYNLFYTSVLDDNFTKKVLSNMNKHLSSVKGSNPASQFYL